MPRNVSDNFKAAAYAAGTKEAFIVLLTISHPNFTDDVRIASDPLQVLPLLAPQRGVVSNGLEYIFLPISVSLPSQDDTGISRASIAIDNVTREIIAVVRAANSAVTVQTQIVLASDPDNVEVNIPDFQLVAVDYDALTVSGEISVEYFDLEPFPNGRITPSYFRGIF